MFKIFGTFDAKKLGRTSGKIEKIKEFVGMLV